MFRVPEALVTEENKRCDLPVMAQDCLTIPQVLIDDAQKSNNLKKPDTLNYIVETFRD